MTHNRDTAIARLVKLHRDYAPLFDALLQATPENVDEFVDRHNALRRQIIHYARLAFGPAAAHRLEILKPICDKEVEELEAFSIAERAHSDSHFFAMQACHIVALRLGAMLRDEKLLTRAAVKTPDIQSAWKALDKERGKPRERGQKTAWMREIADQLDAPFETVKSAIRRM